MKFTDDELRVMKTILTEKLDSMADPSLPIMLSKDIAYLKIDFFHPHEPNKIFPIQTSLRKVIEEIILRRVHQNS